VSFLLSFFHDLVTVLDYKLLSVVAHPVLQRSFCVQNAMFLAARDQIITGA
jgi:hypothetical protein